MKRKNGKRLEKNYFTIHDENPICKIISKSK